MRIHLGIALVILLIAGIVPAEEGVLRMVITDVKERPVEGVVLNPLGAGATSAPSNESGETRLHLTDMRPGVFIKLQLARVSERHPDWVFIDPWDGRIQAHRFDDPQAFVQIVVAECGDWEALIGGRSIKAIT